MSDRDTDIEFDFFEEPETREAARPVRPPLRGGPRRPVRTPQGFTPLLRLVGLIAFVITIIVLLIYAVQGCESSGKHAEYANYMSKVAQIGSHSQSVGGQLATVLLTPGTRTADLERKLAALARDAAQDVDAARAINPPGRLRDEHTHLVDALDYRYMGIAGIASSLPQALKARSATSTVLELPAERLIASDVIWDDSFKDPAKQLLQRDGVGDVRVPESHFVQNPDFYTASSLSSILGRLKGGNVTVKAGGLHGTTLVSVKAMPQGTQLSSTTQTPVVATSNLAFVATILDAGNSAELNIPVTLTIRQTPLIKKTVVLPFINPGERRTVTFGNLGAPQFTTPVKIVVSVKGVPGETNLSDNSATYPVIFTLK
ncbi:MAG TPA: hypothetical protein VF002_04450 [Gaiellaceae bacterium]